MAKPNDDATYTVEIYFDKEPTYQVTLSFDRMMEQFGARCGRRGEDDPHRRRWVVPNRYQASRSLQYLHAPQIRASMWPNVQQEEPT